jgi:hypothetical protein
VNGERQLHSTSMGSQSVQDELINIIDETNKPAYNINLNDSTNNGQRNPRAAKEKNETVTVTALNTALTNALSIFGDQLHENMKTWLKFLFEKIGQRLDEHSERMNSIEDQLSKQEAEIAELRAIIERGVENRINTETDERLPGESSQSRAQPNDGEAITKEEFLEIKQQLSKIKKQQSIKENEKRAKNLIIHGVECKNLENGQEDPFFTAADFFFAKLGIRIITENVFRQGRKNGDKPAPLFVTLENEADKGRIFKNCHKLKGLNISIQNDLSKEDREKRKNLVTKLKELKEQGMSAQLRGIQLYVDGKPYQQ